MHTKSGVNEQTIPTVLTLKNLILKNVINKEIAPCKQRNVRLAMFVVLMLS